jgi:hypothetical protein
MPATARLRPASMSRVEGCQRPATSIVPLADPAAACRRLRGVLLVELVEQQGPCQCRGRGQVPVFGLRPVGCLVQSVGTR